MRTTLCLARPRVRYLASGERESPEFFGGLEDSGNSRSPLATDLSRLPARICTLLGFAIGFLITPASGRANENLRAPLAKIAKAVTQVLQDRGADSIAIGEFTGPPSFASAAGPGIRKVLTEEFTKLGIREKKIGANIGIQGKYLVHEDQPTFAGGTKGPPHLRLIASLVDKNGQVLTELDVEVSVKVGQEDGQPIIDKTKIARGMLIVDSYGGINDIHGAGTLAESLGATVDLKRKNKDGFSGGSESVIESFDNPTAVVLANGSAAAASRESPFQMEILVDGQPRPMKLEDGQPFVQLEKGDSFQIRFTNRASHDVALVFLLDGVSSYAFSDVRETRGPQRGEPKYSKWIVSHNQSFTLKGWHRTNDYVDKFLVTDFAESAAAKLGSANGLGTITASVRATWRAAEKPPADEAAMYKMVIGIGRGDRDSQQVKEDTEQREYGQTRAVITVRYAKPETN